MIAPVNQPSVFSMPDHFRCSANRSSQNRDPARQTFEYGQSERLFLGIHYQHVKAAHERRHIVSGSEKPNAVSNSQRCCRAFELFSVFVIAIEERFANDKQNGAWRFPSDLRERFNKFELAFSRCELPDNADDQLRITEVQLAANLMFGFRVGLKAIEINRIVNYLNWHAPVKWSQ